MKKSFHQIFEMTIINIKFKKKNLNYGSFEIQHSIDSGVYSPEFENANIFNVGNEDFDFNLIDNLNLDNFDLVERKIFN